MTEKNSYNVSNVVRGQPGFPNLVSKHCVPKPTQSTVLSLRGTTLMLTFRIKGHQSPHPLSQLPTPCTVRSLHCILVIFVTRLYGKTSALHRSHHLRKTYIMQNTHLHLLLPGHPCSSILLARRLPGICTPIPADALEPRHSAAACHLASL